MSEMNMRNITDSKNTGNAINAGNAGNATERQGRYERNFTGMLCLATVSDREGGDERIFADFHKLLPETFPHLFATAEIEYFNGSLLLRWKGRSAEKPFLFMNHHDVVSVQDGWSHPPFSAEIADGKIWARGTLDTKGGLWAMLQAADDLCAEGFMPARDIYFESSCNEETTCAGAEEIAGVLKKRGIRFSMILDEGGMIVYEPIGGVKGLFAMIGVGERGCVELKFTARGNGGHASTPEPDTPLVRLGKFMAAADKANIFEVDLPDPIREMFRRFAPCVSGVTGLLYKNPDLFAPLLKTVMPRLSGTSRALVETTLAFTMASGSEGRNVIPAEACVIGNMRVSPHQGTESSIKAVSAFAAKYGIETEVLEPGGHAPLSDYHKPQFAFMEKAVRSVFPDVCPAPYIMTGCSDALKMKELSDDIYHFSPFTINHQQMESIHGTDENVDVKTLVPAVDFYRYLITEMKNCD